MGDDKSAKLEVGKDGQVKVRRWVWLWGLTRHKWFAFLGLQAFGV
jgi:hypothetical protein